MGGGDVEVGSTPPWKPEGEGNPPGPTSEGGGGGSPPSGGPQSWGGGGKGWSPGGMSGQPCICKSENVVVNREGDDAIVMFVKKHERTLSLLTMVLS